MSELAGRSGALLFMLLSLTALEAALFVGYAPPVRYRMMAIGGVVFLAAMGLALLVARKFLRKR